MEDYSFPIDRLMLDAMTTLFCLFAALFAKSHLQAAAEEAQKSALVGDITVNAEWDRGADVDVDLWVKAPGDSDPVGFNHRADRQSSYLRDDVGKTNDFTDLNYEVIGIRGIVPGRYTVNLFMFNNRGIPSTHVSVSVSSHLGNSSSTLKIFSKELDLTVNQAEVTVCSFVLDSSGDVVDLTETYVPLLRAAKEAGQ